MMGLILKDIYSMLKQTKIFLILTIVMALMQNNFLLSYAICYASMLPITALAYDERAKWKKFADMLPYTTTELVGCKYIVGYLSIGATALVAIGSKFFCSLTGKTAFSQEYWATLILTICAALIIQAINLPFMFWIGVERGRLLFILIVIATLFFATTALDNLSFAMQINLPLLLTAALAITAVFHFISFRLSKIAYKH